MEIELKQIIIFKKLYNPVKTIFLIGAVGVFIATVPRKKTCSWWKLCQDFKATLMYNWIQTSLKENTYSYQEDSIYTAVMYQSKSNYTFEGLLLL